MGVSLHGRAQQRLALHLRERCEPCECLAYRYPPVEVCLRGVGARQTLAELAVVVAGHAQHVERRVVHDPVEPRFHIAHLGAGTQSQPRLQESLLQGVLGALVGEQQSPAVAEQLAPIALHQRFEGSLVTSVRKREQTSVALGQRSRTETDGLMRWLMALERSLTDTRYTAVETAEEHVWTAMIE